MMYWDETVCMVTKCTRNKKLDIATPILAHKHIDKVDGAGLPADFIQLISRSEILIEYICEYVYLANVKR